MPDGKDWQFIISLFIIITQTRKKAYSFLKKVDAPFGKKQRAKKAF
jgi:hypothetical protein